MEVHYEKQLTSDSLLFYCLPVLSVFQFVEGGIQHAWKPYSWVVPGQVNYASAAALTGQLNP